MPKFASAIDTQRIPVKGLVPETAGTAPTSPVVGQIWTDTSVTPRVLRVWDGAAWVPLNMYAGTAAGTFAAGDDARITGAVQSTEIGAANGVAPLDGSSNVPYANLPVGTAANTVAAGNDSRITGAAQKASNLSDLANVATARTNLGLGTAATANTGTGTTNVILGNDARLTDQRVPTDASVTGGTAGSGVKIAANTITDANIAAANKDGAAGTVSLRTLGFSGNAAMPGTARLDQIAVPTADINLNNRKITGLAAPTNASDAARLQDVQNAQAGIDAKPSVRVRTSTNINVASPGATLDGVTMVAGDRVLLAGQTTTNQNDIWIWNGAAVAMTRSDDTITPNSFVFVEEGTSADTQWVVTNNGAISRGTTTITWTQFGGATNYTGTANRITVTGTTVDIAATYVGQTSITTLGTITSGTWNASTIAVARGGTGATDAATARTNLNASQRGFAADLGTVTAGTPVTVTHSLGTQDVVTQVRETATQQIVETDLTNSTATTVSIRTDVSYASGALRVVVIPVG